MEPFRPPQAPMTGTGQAPRQAGVPVIVRPQYYWGNQPPGYGLPYPTAMPTYHPEARRYGYQVQRTFPPRFTGVYHNNIPVVEDSPRNFAVYPTYIAQSVPMAPPDQPHQPRQPSVYQDVGCEEAEASWTLVMMSRGVRPSYGSSSLPGQAQPVVQLPSKKLPAEKPAGEDEGNLTYDEVYKDLSALGAKKQTTDNKAWKELLDHEARSHN